MEREKRCKIPWVWVFVASLYIYSLIDGFAINSLRRRIEQLESARAIAETGGANERAD